MGFKLKIANDINYKGLIGRTIRVDQKLNIKEGDNYKFYKEVESWAGEYSSVSFHVENSNKYEYYFYCKDGVGHAVDYENEEECQILNATGCEDEGEVLVTDKCKMRIVSISNDEDYKEMGYYEIELERI